MSPIFWEAQELQCFHEKVGPSDDIIGIGFHADGRGKLAKLTAHFDAVSLTAWRGGLRRAAWKESMTHWLPLFINTEHASAASPITDECLALLADCAATGADSHLPAAVFKSLASAGAPPQAAHAVTVLPEMMHQLLKQVLDGDRHASSKVLKGYFVLHRLFLHFCDKWPAIRDAADRAIFTFCESPDQRTKTVTPWMAYLLQLLTVSNIGWDHVKHHFCEEGLARDVQFVLASSPNYHPIDPDAEAETAASPLAVNPFGDWALFEHDHGTDSPGEGSAKVIMPGVWEGRPSGWTCLAGPFKPQGRHAFSVRVRSMPKDSVIRIGWTAAEVCTPFNGWTYLASGGCFGKGSWASQAHENSSRGCTWMPYGKWFGEGDVVTACIDRGVITFQVNDIPQGIAFRVAEASFRSLVALKRGAEVELLEADVHHSAIFATPEQLRNLAWEARLCRRGKALILFQVFFLSLVRPHEGVPNWDALKHEYDHHFGFPSAEKTNALMEHFGEVHRVVRLHGCDAWPLFFKMIGLGDISDAELDRWLFSAYKRATTLGYKMGGRHDHA